MTIQQEYDNRESDKKVNILIQQLAVLHDAITRIELKQQEISMRQQEMTIPTLIKLEKCIYGNGKKGLMDEHAVCQEKLNRYDKMTDKLVAIIITIILQFVLTGSGLAFLYFKR